MPDPRPRPRPFARAGDRAPAWYQVGPVLALATTEPDTAEPTTATSADVYVYDVFGGWFGMTADDFVRDVASLDVDRITLHLNSPGGDAFEGVAIANVLRAHRAHVTVRVDGMAASAASVIAMAGDEIVMGIGSQMMIHDASGVTVGNAAEVERFLRRLDATSDSLASTYAARAGGTAEEWRAVMRAESWYTPEEAVAAGLADRVATADETATAEGEQIAPGGTSGFWDLWDSLASPDRFDLSAFHYAGRSHAPAPAMPGRQTPAASAAGDIEQERSSAVAFSPEQLTTMRQKLGLADDAPEQTIVDALTEALDEQAETPAPAAAALPAGMQLVDEGTLAALRASAQLGEAAHTRQQREDREALVAAAIGDGRIPPARRGHWLTQLENDPGAAETLAAMPKGLIPVGEPKGHASASLEDPASHDDYWFPGVVSSSSREG